MTRNQRQSGDQHAVTDLLLQLRSQPSSRHDEVVLDTARRLLGGAGTRRQRRWQLAAAVAAGFLLCTSFMLHQNRPSPYSTVRAPTAATQPYSGERLDTLPTRLKWPAVAGATGYRVTLRNASADILWTSTRLDSPHLDLPASALDAIAGQATCIWSVETEDAIRTQQLGPFWFHFEGR